MKNTKERLIAQTVMDQAMDGTLAHMSDAYKTENLIALSAYILYGSRNENPAALR